MSSELEPVHNLESFRPPELEYLFESNPIWLSDKEYGIFHKAIRYCVDAAVVTPDNRRVLLVERHHPEGWWSVPGGMVRDLHRSDEEELKVKVLEEAGLVITIESFVKNYRSPLIDRVFWTREKGYQVHPAHQDAVYSVGATYLTRPVGGSPRAGRGMRDARFFEWENLPDVLGSHIFTVLNDVYHMLGYAGQLR